MLIDTIRLFSVKGPDYNITGSNWEKEHVKMRSKIQHAGAKALAIKCPGYGKENE